MFSKSEELVAKAHKLALSALEMMASFTTVGVKDLLLDDDHPHVERDLEDLLQKAIHLVAVAFATFCALTILKDGVFRYRNSDPGCKSSRESCETTGPHTMAISSCTCACSSCSDFFANKHWRLSGRLGSFTTLLAYPKRTQNGPKPGRLPNEHPELLDLKRTQNEAKLDTKRTKNTRYQKISRTAIWSDLGPIWVRFRSDFGPIPANFHFRGQSRVVHFRSNSTPTKT